MKRKLIVYTGDGLSLVFGPVTHSWIEGSFLLFHTEESGPDNPCGINMGEVIGWKFVAENETGVAI